MLGLGLPEPLHQVWARLSRRRSVWGWLVVLVGAAWEITGIWSRGEFISGKLSLLRSVFASAWEAISSVDQGWYQAALIIAGLLWVAYVASRPETQPKGPVFFKSQGFYWELTHNFWPYAASFDAENALFGSGGGVIGPLCPNSECKLDVSDDLIAHRSKCRRCNATLAPAIEISPENKPGIISRANSDPLFPLRKAAYRDAQAAMRRGDITRP